MVIENVAAIGSLLSSGNALWVSRYGGAIGYSRVEGIISELTRKLFGRSVCPHLLRDGAVHFVVVNAGDQMGIASVVLMLENFVHFAQDRRFSGTLMKCLFRSTANDHICGEP
jgi:hypothetical protein